MRKAPILMAGLCAFSLAGIGHADTLMTEQSFAKTSIAFQPRGDYLNGTLTITGPDGFSVTAFSKKGLPSIDLANSGALEDGEYVYELTAAIEQPSRVRTMLDDGRGDGAMPPRLQAVTESGTFRVENGAIVGSKMALMESDVTGGAKGDDQDKGGM